MNLYDRFIPVSDSGYVYDKKHNTWLNTSQKVFEAILDYFGDRNPTPAEVPATGTPLPCPHCGTAATKRRYQHDASRFFYACPNTDCNATHTDETEALAAWNRRTLSTGLACQAPTSDPTPTKETP